MKSVAAILLLLVLAGCTSEPQALKVLEAQGYTEIKFTGYRAFLCGDDYTFHTGFSANTNVIVRGKDGNPVVVQHAVTGAVCEGYLKGASIKLDD